MTISTKRLTEIRFMISDLLQRDAWEQLFADCGTRDLELARSVANIFGMFDPVHVWKFVDYVARLPADKRREKRESTIVVCYTIGRIAASNPRKALRSLRQFLLDDHMLRQAVEASLSNLWIYNRRATQKELFKSWISDQNSDDLQEIAVQSSSYLLGEDPKSILPFFIKVMRLRQSSCAVAKSAVKELAKQHGILSKISIRIDGRGNKDRRTKNNRYILHK